MHNLFQANVKGGKIKDTIQRDNYFVCVLCSHNITSKKARYITLYSVQSTGWTTEESGFDSR